MSPEHWRRIEELYQAALERPSGERAALLAQADPEVRRQVEVLLAQPSAGSPLDRAAWEGMTSEFVLAPGRKIGNFEIVSLLGRGGMGEVYRARDLRLKREVAVKVLPESFAGDRVGIARFEREARAASALNHPNIVAVFDVGAEGGTHWIASELVVGESLQTLISRGPLVPRKAIEIAAQIAEGLAAAHASAIVHRDLKPGNIMVARDGRVKILDFGLAKQRRTATEADATVTEDLTDTGMIMGTAAYMSPEQVRGEDVDARADIFSLGLILHEMLSGKRAFSGDSSVEVMNAILKNDPPELSPAVPPTLARIVGRCLEKEPARRFQSAADLSFALSSVFGAPPRRSREKAIFVLMALAILLVAISAWFWEHSRPAKSAGRSLTRLTTNGSSFHPAISRDGKMLAYAAAIGGPNRNIWIQQVAGGKAIQITHEEEGAVRPVFSPDETQIAYESHGGIYEVPTLGGAARLITSEGYFERYTPDGSNIVFMRDVQEGSRLFTVPRIGGTPTAVRPELVTPYWLALSPDGKRILTHLAGKEREEQDPKRWWTLSIPAGKPEEIEPPAVPPGHSDVGTPLAWVSLDRASPQQWVIFWRSTGARRGNLPSQAKAATFSEFPSRAMVRHCRMPSNSRSCRGSIGRQRFPATAGWCSRPGRLARIYGASRLTLTKGVLLEDWSGWLRLREYLTKTFRFPGTGRRLCSCPITVLW